MRYVWLIVISVSVLSTSLNRPCQWDQYLGTQQRTAYSRCTGPDSPEILWETPLEGEVDNPFIIGDRVIVFCRSYCIFPSPPDTAPQPSIAVIDLLTGTLLQHVPASGLVGAYPLHEKVALGLSPEKLYEIDLLSQAYSPVSDIPPTSFCGPHCYPVILPDKVIFPRTPAVCLSLDGYSTLWDLQSSLGPAYPEAGKTVNLAASDNVYLIVGSEEGRKLLAVDADSGNLIWERNAAKALNIAVEGSRLFLGGDHLYCLASETGEVLWEVQSGFVSSNIVVGPTSVYFADFENYLYAVDKSSGSVKWKTQWEGVPNFTTYLVGAGDILVLSNSMNVFSFSTEGTKLWELHFQSEVEMCPATADGIILVGEKMNHKLIALASDPELFVKQGDSYVSSDITRAVNSYKKAAELYEKKGDISRSQEILNQIQDLENQPGSSTPASQEPIVIVHTFPPPQRSPVVLFSTVVCFAITLVGVLILRYFEKKS